MEQSVRDLSRLTKVYEQAQKITGMTPGQVDRLGVRSSIGNSGLPIDTRPIDLTRDIRSWAAEVAPLVRGIRRMGLVGSRPTSSELTLIAGSIEAVESEDPDLARDITHAARQFLGRWWAIVSPGGQGSWDDRWRYVRSCPECGVGELWGYRFDHHVECRACHSVWTFELLADAVSAVPETADETTPQRPC